MNNRSRAEGRPQRPPPEPQRVLMVLDYYFPFLGGAENFSHLLSQQLQRMHQVKVDVLTGQWISSHAHQQVVAGLPVHRAYILWGLSTMRGLELLAQFLLGLQMAYFIFRRSHKYDVVHFHGLSRAFIIPALIARQRNVPILITSNRTGSKGDLGVLQGAWLAQLYLKLIKFCRPMIVATSDLAEYEFKSAGFHPGRIARVPRGVEIPENLPKRDWDISQEKNEETNKPRVIGAKGEKVNMKNTARSRKLLYIGRLSEDKGVDVLIKALEYIKNHQDKRDLSIFELSIVGRGRAEGQLRRLAENCGLSKWVRFCGEQSEMQFFHAKHHLFVLPTRRQSVSSALLEAMASGMPAIVSKVGMNAEIVQNGLNGWVVEPGDPKILAEAILKFYSQGVGWDAQKISQWIRSSFDIRRVSDAYMQIYGMLLNLKAREVVNPR